MAKDSPDDGPSLELPSLFGRRRKKTATAEPPAEPEKPVADTEPATTVTEVQADDAQPDSSAARSSQAEAPTEPPAVPDEQAPAETVRTAETARDEAPAEPAPEPEPTPEPDRTAVLPPLPTPADEPEVPAKPTRSPAKPPAREPAAKKVSRPRQGPARVPRQLPELAASTAVLVVGALVGLLGAALTFLGLQGCEVVTSTDSCGGPGLLVLIVIVVAMILAGAALLRMFRVPEAGNISFLGVGMLVVIMLLFLLDHLYDRWMTPVVVVLTALCFGVARWVARQISEDLFDDDTEMHDVR